METDLGFTFDNLSMGAGINYAGLAVGCIFFIPLVHRYGRRPIYIFSVTLQLASCIWQAKVHTFGDLIGSNLISGLGGAISEIIAQITIADMFFVHQHATMNGWYVIFQSTGAFLGPVASGYITVSQGWRWMWWWCVIFFGVTLLCVIFLFEESKYIPLVGGHGVTPIPASQRPNSTGGKLKSENEDRTDREAAANRVAQSDIKPKTYRQRMALVTTTDESIWQHVYQPFITLLTFPAVTYCAITYGTTLCWFAVMTSLQASYMIYVPYNFSAIGIGLMNLPPFLGALLGFPFGGYICDKFIMRLSKRNGGIYEPEMRLWLALPVAIISPAGILMFGIGIAHVCFYL